MSVIPDINDTLGNFGIIPILSNPAYRTWWPLIHVVSVKSVLHIVPQEPLELLEPVVTAVHLVHFFNKSDGTFVRKTFWAKKDPLQHFLEKLRFRCENQNLGFLDLVKQS